MLSWDYVEMKIIKTLDNNYIQVDPQPTEPGYVWGQRWNRNEQKWSSQCILYKVDHCVEVTEDVLPKR